MSLFRRARHHGRSLSLPVLLSFNELAWVAIGGAMLFCLYLWSDSITVRKENQLVPKAEYASLTNNSSADLAAFETRLTSLQKETNALHRQLQEFQRVSNSLSAQVAFCAANHTDLTNLQQKVELCENTHSNLAHQLSLVLDTNKQLRTNLTAWATNFANQPRIRKELLNLKGGLTNVVILVDRSASMNTGDRWADALGVIKSWLTHLDIQKCALVVFNDKPVSFPANNSWLDVTEESRTNLVAEVKSLKPTGNTGTLEALQRAYTYPGVDTIILFTDGKPYLPSSFSERHREVHNSAAASRRLIEQVLQLAAANSDVCINAVGLGEYFDKEQGEFLLKLTSSTGGAFIGR